MNEPTERTDQGQINAVIQILKHRHGALDAATEARINALSPDAVDELSVVLFNFRQFTDLEDWLYSQTDSHA